MLSPATPNHNFTPGLQYGYDPNLATDAATSYRRVQPGLTLQAGSDRLRRDEQTEVQFTVRDAGPRAGREGQGRWAVAGYTGATERLAVRR